MANPLYINWRQRSLLPYNKEFRKLGIPMFNEDEKKLPFKHRIANFFIEHGNYRITQKAELLPEVQEKLKNFGRTISCELKDAISNRDKDENYIEGIASLTPKEKKRIIANTVADLIGNGCWQYLVEQNAILSKAPKGYWTDGINRTFWVKELVACLNKDPRDLSTDDLEDNGLRSIRRYCDESVFKAVTEAYPEKGIKAWEMATTPMRFFNATQNRIAAVKWLCETKLAKSGKPKDPRSLICDDFKNNRLGGLIQYPHYCFSTFKAASEAYPEQGINEWEMATTPMSFYEETENRIAAVRWLCEVKLAKDGKAKNPRELKTDDFIDNRLGGLLACRYESSPFLAVSEAYPELNLIKDDMTHQKGYQNKKKL